MYKAFLLAAQFDTAAGARALALGVSESVGILSRVLRTCWGLLICCC
jgi:hypothetical protein